MPQIVYGQQPAELIGQVMTIEPATIDTLTNELLPQISTVTGAGTGANGTYSQTITGPDGETVTGSFVQGGGAGTPTTVSQGILAAFQALADYANIATGASPAAVLTHTFIHPGRVYSISTIQFAGTQTVANTQTAGGVAIELGTMVAEGSADDLAALLTGATLDDGLAGMVVRGIDALVNDLGATTSRYDAGATLSVLRRGEVAVLAEDAVTKGADVFVRIQNPGPGDPVGLLRSDVAGGDAIAVTGARFASTTTGRGIVRVRFNRP